MGKNVNMNLVEKGSEIIETETYSFTDKWSVDFAKLDWNLEPLDIDATYAWYLHQMGYLNDLIEYEKYHQNKRAIYYILKFLKPWWEAFKDDTSNRRAWHDHATAFRAVNLLNLYMYLKENSKDLEYISFVEEMLVGHKSVLLEESFYVRLTNHGMDQSLSLYQISHILGDNEAKEIAITRINQEMKHAFCEDGGHKENSPAYLYYGMSQIIKALQVARKIDGNDCEVRFPNEILEKAMLFAGFIVQPNGKLPLIGDTKDFIPNDIFKDLFSSSSCYENYLYAIRQGRAGVAPESNDIVLYQSGWAVFRSTWDKVKFPKSLQFVFKCGYLSRYHRQDDDLTCTLFNDGEEWLVDGGEYRHDNRDPYRKYFRSHLSHNLSYPCSVAACRDLEEIKTIGESRIEDYSVSGDISCISGISWIFRGFENRRKITYDRKKSTLIIHDTCSPYTKEAEQIIKDKQKQQNPTYITRFHIPQDKSVSLNRVDNIVSVSGKTSKMILSAPNFKGVIKATFGQDKPPLGYISRKSGVLEKAWCVEFIHKTPILNQTFEIRFVKEIKIDIKTSIVGDTLKAYIKNTLDTPHFYYCFVLMQDGHKIETRWYQKSNKVEFATKINKDSEYSILGYVKDENKEICARKTANLRNMNDSTIGS